MKYVIEITLDDERQLRNALALVTDRMSGSLPADIRHSFKFPDGTVVGSLTIQTWKSCDLRVTEDDRRLLSAMHIDETAVSQ